MRVSVEGSFIRLDFRYNPKLIAKLKETGVAQWEPHKRCWLMSPSLEAFEFLQNYEEGFELSNGGDKLVLMLDALLRKEEHSKERRALSEAVAAKPIKHVLDKCVGFTPKPFQWVPCHYSKVAINGNFMILDDMGLGKTLEAIMVTLMPDYEKHPVLIVGLPSTLYNWQRELIEKFGLKSHVIEDGDLTELIPGIRYYIVSAKSLVSKQVLKSSKKGKKIPVARVRVKKANWICIIDEVHEFKNKKAQKTVAVREILKQAKHVIELTGTPIPNRPIELHPALEMLDKSCMNWSAFAKKFCGAYFDGFGLKTGGATNLEQLYEYIYNNYAIRRMKTVVIGQMPPKTRQVIELAHDVKINTESTLGDFSASAQAKAADERFIEYIENKIDSGEKILLFAHHQVLINKLEEIAISKGVKYIKIVGGMTKKQKFEACEQFRNDPMIQVAVLSLLTASTGLDGLQAASLVVMCELFWTPANILQAEDRAWRMNSQNAVFVMYPLLTDFEQEIFKMILDKVRIIEKAIEGKHHGIDSRSAMKEISARYGKPIAKKKIA